MSKYAVTIHFPDGDHDLYGERFSSYREAQEAALEAIGAWNTGSEILNMSNPGDYPYDENDMDDVDFDIDEVDD